MAGSYDSTAWLYRVLVDGCLSLEASHARLKPQIYELVEDRRSRKEGETMMSEPGTVYVPGFFTTGSPYKMMLNSIGRAVHVCSASSGEILFWNRLAENLYGWRDYELIGHTVAELLIAEEYYESLNEIMEILVSGKSWSGLFPFKNKSGEVFMAMATKSPMYEDGELACIITVSSDAALFISADEENLRETEILRKGECCARVPRINLKKVHWSPPPPIAPVPQIASSVSNPASRFIPWKCDDDASNAHAQRNAEDLKSRCLMDQQYRGQNAITICKTGGAKLMSAVHQKNLSNLLKFSQRMFPLFPIVLNCLVELKAVCYESSGTKASEGHCLAASSMECSESIGLSRHGLSFSRFNWQEDEDESQIEAQLGASDIEDVVRRERDGKQIPSLGDGTGSQGSSSSEGKLRESNPVVNCEIHWEDILLSEDVGKDCHHDEA